MANTPKYQIAFQFQFKQDVSNEILQINITDQNTFVLAAKESLQLSPYSGSATPPLSNMSVTSNSLFINVASGKSGQGMEIIVWTTFIGGSPFQLDLTANGGSVAAYYSVLGGTGGSGSLSPGPNSISPNGSGESRG